MVRMTEDGDKIFSIEQAESLAAAKTAERASLSAAVKAQMTEEVATYAQNKVYDVQEQMEEISNVIYSLGGTVYEGITGAAANAASDKLRDLSGFSGFDAGALSIKLSE